MKKYKNILKYYNVLKKFYDGGFKLLNILSYKNKIYIFLIKNKKTFVYRIDNYSVPLYMVEIKNIEKWRKKGTLYQSLYLFKETKNNLVEVNIDELYKYVPSSKQYGISKYLIYNNIYEKSYYLSILNHLHAKYEDVNIGAIDIEVYHENNVVPDVNSADYPLCLVTIFDFHKETAFVFYLSQYLDNENEEEIKNKILNHVITNNEKFLKLIKNIKINLNQYNDEGSLLEALHKKISEYQLLFAWFSGFDIPYIINRSAKFGITYKYFTIFDGFNDVYVMENGFIFDFISLYKFFVNSNPVSQKLDYICNKEIGIGKLETMDMIKIEYNIFDAFLIYLLNHELSLIEAMFDFKENGSLLHIFQMSNLVLPLLLKEAKKKKMVFISSPYTFYYTIYFNEVYKFINRQIYQLEKKDLYFLRFKTIYNFFKNINKFNKIVEFYSQTMKEKKSKSKGSDDISQLISYLSDKIVNKQTKRKSLYEEKTKKFIDSLQGKNLYLDDDIDIKNMLIDMFGNEIDKIKYKGAFNKAFRGIDEDILVFDFFSMYPVIMFNLNFSIETVKYLVPFFLNVFYAIDNIDSIEKYFNKCNYVYIYDFEYDNILKIDKIDLLNFLYKEFTISASGCLFYKDKKGIIPPLVKFLLEKRDVYKKMYKKEDIDEIEKKKYYIRQLRYKYYANSLYGYVGYLNSVIYNKILVSSVSLTARLQILLINYYLNQEFKENK